MITVHLLIDVLALVCFFLAALDISVPRLNLLALGLFLWLLGAVVA